MKFIKFFCLIILLVSCTVNRRLHHYSLFSNNDGIRLYQIVYGQLEHYNNPYDTINSSINNINIESINIERLHSLNRDYFLENDFVNRSVFKNSVISSSREESINALKKLDAEYYYLTKVNEGDIILEHCSFEGRRFQVSDNYIKKSREVIKTLYLFYPSLKNHKTISKIGTYFSVDGNSTITYVKKYQDGYEFIDSTITSHNVMSNEKGETIPTQPTIRQKFRFIDGVIELIEE